MSPSPRAGEVIVILKDEQKLNYRLHIDPEGAIICDVSPGWMSGFSEPYAPDYFKRTIRFEHLMKTATITIRRPIRSSLGDNKLDASNFPTSSYEVNSTSPCALNKSDIYEDATKRFLHLMAQFWSLSTWKYTKDQKPLKVWLNPDEAMPELQPGETEQTIEVHCKDDACNQIIVTRLEARIKRTGGN